MLSLYNPDTPEEMTLANQEIMRRAEEERQRTSMLRPMKYDPVQPEEAQAQPNYMGMARNAIGAYDKATGSNYGGYLGAAATFGKFVDWAFDKDATGGGLGRRNIHWLEDGFREGVKDPIKKVPGVKPVFKTIGNLGSSVGDIFSKLF